jgi:phage-related protein
VKSIKFIGTSLDDLREFPADARQEAGFQLDRVQRGLDPDDWKPMKTIGPGVREIRIREASGAFRIIYVTKIETRVFVLHVFQKKTQATSKRDIDLAAKRLKELLKGSLLQ